MTTANVSLPKINTTAMCKSELSVTTPSHWFLQDGEFAPSRSTIEFLINGETAFRKIYEEIEQATSSVDILIWGFQPSMFFIRDGQKLCIGDLLIKKARSGVEVRVLVWSMMFEVQTFKEASLGSGLTKKRTDAYHTEDQKAYDQLWYEIFYKKQYLSLFKGMKILNTLRQSKIYNLDALGSVNSIVHNNLKFATHSVSAQPNKYLDNVYIRQARILELSATHHQKTVLIDYAKPSARGFVLEHNMLDNYWDTDSHKPTNTEDIPYSNTRRNAGPLQDVSSFVRGELLYEINENFCQSWKDTKEDLKKVRKKSKEDFRISDEGQLYIQALRTYDEGNVEDIKELYLQNIKQTTSFIYTENQYFRWTPLVEEFKKYWEENMKPNCRMTPIYWFVVTNSSNAGLGDGTANTDRMLTVLGRRDVMPNVALARDKELQQKYKQYKSENGITNKSNELGENDDFIEEMFEDVSETVGIKTHVCVLSAMGSKKWEEVYVHSKVTIINDVFLTMGSANINTRSMQADTEFNIAMEHGEKVKQLRKDLWGLHSNNRIKLNPENMYLNTEAGDAFEVWGEQLDLNVKLKEQKQKPMMPLTPFLRMDPTVSVYD
jgi:phosphatidylserine/phosphatidylglycerophosphate/cardiolipin synthase-like enzyme